MNTDVIIVGAGPSGLTAAAELALHGCRVVVLERRERPVQSRAGTVLPRVLELLDYRGHAQEFIARAKKIRSNPFLLVHIWAGMQPIHWRNLDSAFPYRLILPQNVTEEALREIAESLGVEIRMGRTVVDLDQDDTGVSVSAELNGGARETYRAAYVIGADGGRSAVRTLCGIDFLGHDGTFSGVIADLRVNMNWAGGRAMTDNERGWVTSFPFGQDGETTRFNFVHVDRRHADKSEPVTEEEVRRCLGEILERDIEFDELIWASRYTDAMRLADRFRDGRAFLVGESARIHYPASGVGMNFCIQDAFNLGWKLAQVVKGKSPEAILDTYEVERRPVTEALLESVGAQCATQFDFSSEGIAFRRMFARDLLPLPEANREIALQLNGITESYPTAASPAHPGAGRPVPHLLVQTTECLRRLPELLHPGRFLLLDLTANDVFADVRIDGLDVVSGVLSQTPEGWRDVTAALIRPDGYLHWITTEMIPSIDEARERLADWFIRS